LYSGSYSARQYSACFSEGICEFSIDNARNATENQAYRDKFLSIKNRLDTAAVKGKALDLCQELFLADGARSDEEDAVLQNLKKLLE
jgi:hypothetical protein